MDILDKARQIRTERENNYDDPRANFQRIADYWNIYLFDIYGKAQGLITSKNVADMMVLMKMAREQYKHMEDNYLDMIGYISCADTIINKEREDKNGK